jgi:hypothetical protein
MPGTNEPEESEMPNEPGDIVDDEPEHEADDQEHRVAHRPNPLPSREEDEEELAEADLFELDDDDVEGDDD